MANRGLQFPKSLPYPNDSLEFVMGIQFFNHIDTEDQLMIEVGRRLQLTQTEQKSNRERYEALSDY